MATIILLPGMDGSGSLFEDFIASLPPDVEAMVVKYPPDRALDYAELEALARAALPIQGSFLLVGESFSGPVAVALAASSPRSEEHTSELQSRFDLVCRLLL